MSNVEITIQNILESYEKTGLIPAAYTFAEVRGDKVYACALTSLYVNIKSYTIDDMKEFINKINQMCVAEIADVPIVKFYLEKYSLPFLEGFINGFDDPSLPACVKLTDEYMNEYTKGFNFGATAREAVTKNYILLM